MSEDLQRELAGLGEGGDPRGVEMGAVERRVGERRRRRAAAVAGVLACVVPLGWAAVSGAMSRTSVAPATTPMPECPGSLSGDWQPPAPEEGLALHGRLAPATAPESMTICRYEPGLGGGDRHLVGTRSITDGLDEVGADLAAVATRPSGEQISCMVDAITTPYVVRLEFAQGSMWVAAEADETCSYEDTSTSNGADDFDHIGNDLADVYEAGSWSGLGPRRCAAASVRRAGGTSRLVPPGVSSATVCSLISGKYATHDVQEEELARLVRELSAAPLVPRDSARDALSTTQCEPGGSVPATRHVVLRYDDGPAVVVSVYPGCEPPLVTGSRRAGLTPELRDLLDLPAES